VYWYRRLILYSETVCIECGKRAETLDHIIPLAIGRIKGLSDVDGYSNFQPMCNQCHKAKTALDKQAIAAAKRERGMVQWIGLEEP
jgi:5-methylcytosine-specific restriction endonuclease McrA